MKELLLGAMMASFLVTNVHARVDISKALGNKIKKVFSKDNISDEADAHGKAYDKVKKGKVLTEAEIKTLNAAVADLSEQADSVFQSLKAKEIEKHLKVVKKCVDTIVNFAKSAEKKTTVDKDTSRKIHNAVGGIKKANTKHLVGRYPDLFRSFREHVTAAGDVLNQLSRRNPNNEVL